MDTSQQIDSDIAELERAAAQKRRKTLITIGAVLLALPAYWAMGFSSVRSSLEGDGHTDVKVSAAGAFEYTFESKKGASNCSGRVTRLPFTTSTSSFCYAIDASGRASGSTGTSTK